MARSSTSSMSRSGSSLSLPPPQDPREAAEDSFRTLVVNISEELEKKDVEKIRYLYKRDLGAGRQKLSALKSLDRLEEKGVFSFYCVLPLKQLLRNVHRLDLVPSVDSYAEAHSSIVTVQGFERAPSCGSLLTHTTALGDDSEPESHEERVSLLSCPSDLGAMAMGVQQGTVSSQFVSQESLDDPTEVHSKSLLVSRNVEYPLPDRRANSLNSPRNQVSLNGSRREGASKSEQHVHGPSLNLAPPPLFLSKNTRANISGPQTSSVQCSQTISIKPSQDTIAKLQDTLHRTDNDTKVDPPDPDSYSNFSNPATNKHNISGGANIEQQFPPLSPLNRVRSRYLARTPSQTSQCSVGTVKANSSGSNSPVSSEVWETPHSSPLLNTRRSHASGSKVCCQSTQCTEASLSLNEHRLTSEDWQTHSIKSYIQGTSYIVSQHSSGEHQSHQSSSRLDNHWYEILMRSQPISREAMCTMICRFTDQQEDSIAFQEELIFPHGPRLKFSLNPRGTGEYCSLNTTVSIAKQHWPQSDPTINIVLSVSVVGNNNQIIQQTKEHNLIIEQRCCKSPQKVTVPEVILHGTVTHEITDSFLFFVITAKICHDHFAFRISDTSEEYVHIDFKP